MLVALTFSCMHRHLEDFSLSFRRRLQTKVPFNLPDQAAACARSDPSQTAKEHGSRERESTECHTLCCATQFSSCNLLCSDKPRFWSAGRRLQHRDSESVWWLVEDLLQVGAAASWHGPWHPQALVFTSMCEHRLTGLLRRKHKDESKAQQKC